MSARSVSLRSLAHQCRRMAMGGGMESVKSALHEMAVDYDRQADRVDRAEARTREQLAGRQPD